MKSIVLLVLLCTFCALVLAPNSTEAGKGKKYNHVYHVDPAGWQFGITGVEYDCRRAAEKARQYPECGGKMFKHMAKEKGHYLCAYLKPNGLPLRVGDEDLVVTAVLNDGKRVTSIACFFFHDGRYQLWYWDSRKDSPISLDNEEMEFERNKKGTIALCVMFPEGSLRANDVKEISMTGVVVKNAD